MQIKYSCFLEVLCFFVYLSSLKILLHIFTNNGDISKQSLIFDFSGNVESSLNVSKLDQCSCCASEAFDIVLFDDCLWNSLKLSVYH
jgi:hypothetical protein